jgi:hypothetical protein
MVDFPAAMTGLDGELSLMNFRFSQNFAPKYQEVNCCITMG